MSDCEPLEGNSVTPVPRTKGERSTKLSTAGVRGEGCLGGGLGAEEKDAEPVGNRPVTQGEGPKLF